MVGACRPAACATSVNRARNGMPEGFPRGVGFAPRVATPCALTLMERPRNGRPAIRRSRWRREVFTAVRPSEGWADVRMLFRYIRVLRVGFARLQPHFMVHLFQMFLYGAEPLEFGQFSS